MPTAPTTTLTQVDRAIEALLDGWLSPKQLTAASGRANPQGIARDARREAARRGLVWREVWVRDAVTKRPYKMHHIERPQEAERRALAGSCEAASGHDGGGSGDASKSERQATDRACSPGTVPPVAGDSRRAAPTSHDGLRLGPEPEPEDGEQRRLL